MAKSGILFARLSDLRSEGNATTLNGSNIVITRYLQGWKIVVTTGDIVQQLAVTDSLMDIIVATVLCEGMCLQPHSNMDRDVITLIPVEDIIKDYVERHKDDEPWSEDRRKEQE